MNKLLLLCMMLMCALASCTDRTGKKPAVLKHRYRMDVYDDSIVVWRAGHIVGILMTDTTSALGGLIMDDN